MRNQLLIQARARKVWSPEQASQHVGVAEKTYRSWEAGTHIPQIRQLNLLRRAFGSTAENLGYIIDEKGHIQLKPGEDDFADLANPTGSLAVAYEDMIESLRRNLMLFSGMGSSEEEASEMDKIMRVVLSVLSPSLDMASVGVGMWLCDRVNKLKAIGTCGLWITVQQYQAIAYAEIESWQRMIEEDYQLTEAYRSTRRIVIGGLALFPASFLTMGQLWPMSDSVAKGFLIQCAPCIIACSDLLKSGGLTAVEQVLPQYLRPLIRLAKSPSPVQKEAAYLAAQGYYLMSTVKYHRRQLGQSMAHCKQGVELAKVTGDRLLVAAAFARLGTAYSCSDQLQEYLEAYQEAERLIPQDSPLFPPRLQSRIYMGLSNAHARLGNKQEADLYLSMANAITLLSDDDLFIPCLSYDLSNKISVEGQVYVNLAKLKDPDPNHTLSKEGRTLYENADTALGQPLPTDVSEGSRLQGINQRAEIAIVLGRKEKFIEYCTEGALGAKAIDSEQRLQEAKKAWRAARRQWPDEDDVQNLDEYLF